MSAGAAPDDSGGLDVAIGSDRLVHAGLAGAVRGPWAPGMGMMGTPAALAS